MNTDHRFFNYARERQHILLRRAKGIPRPWSNDPIMTRYRFCNVFREDDRTTIWIREHVRDPLRDDPAVLLAMVVARWFNRISTLEILHEAGLFKTWNTARARLLLTDVQPLVTAAYMVKTPAKMSKLEGLLQCIDRFVEDTCQSSPHNRGQRMIWNNEHDIGNSLEGTTIWIRRSPYLGPFMAYEIVTDLRYTDLLDRAPDIMTWANPGPGATRGAGRILYDDATYLNRARPDDVEEIMELMQGLLIMSQDPQYWPPGWPSWEMREVEHTLCEWDKYERTRLGEGKPKQLYKTTI